MINIYYHNADLDGLCSAAIMFTKYGHNARYIGVDYKDRPLTLDLDAEANIFVDFSPQGTLRAELPANVQVFDHHKTSVGLPGVIDTTRAACQIVWAELYPDRPEPMVVSYVGKADTWQKDDPHWASTIVPFCLALWTERWPVASPHWQRFFDDDTYYPGLIRKGQEFQAFLKGWQAEIAQEQAFETYFAGLKFIALIGGEKGSHRFESVYNPHKHDAMMVARRQKDDRWVYSMYANDRDNIDLSEIAKQYGGGGHKGAAGFIHTELLV